MSAPGNAMSPEPRYTIEQISLLHRLLRTGLTKQDIIHALDSMSKMDAELQASNMPLLGSGSYSAAAGSKPSSGQGLSGALRFGAGAARGAGVGPCQGREAEAIGEQAAGGEGRLIMQGGGPGILQGMSPEVICGMENFHDVSEEDLESLFRRGPMAVKSEIRTFLTKFRLSQNQISLATGISQSYISSFLIHGFMMKRTTQELLYRWYLGKRKEMEDLDVQPQFEHLDNGPLPNRTIDLCQAYPSPTSDNFLPTFKRRERFTWKDSHVRILESYYNKNPYPNDFEREKITEACNSEQQQSGETVPDSKWVTSSKVYNWFANRRKDSNRRKRLSQRMGPETSSTVHSASGDYNAANDHTHYASTSPQDLQVIEVCHDDGGPVEHHAAGDLEQEVHVVEMHVDGEGPAQDQGGHAGDQKVMRRPSDAKPYGGVNTIYTLIEAVQESDMSKNS